jgi:serine/threonine protein kinase
MALAAGTQLGRYEVRSKIAEGGMGEVYLAQDTKLDRRVALKILPEDVASHPQRMQRFVQEAKAASSLNHPNILTIYEIGTETGAHFIATEFIDGETLGRQMLRSLPAMTEAIDIASQVASALASAHAAGIVHRDIKPENIMVRRDGIVKVLDFGLAKLTEGWRADEVDQDAATKAMVQTEPGVVMGTTAYMSPEQVRGLELDPRTDIWSLGVVLYEMITGSAPFKSETAGDTSAAILKSEPLGISQHVPDTPWELERIVRKALEKDREERYQVVKDLLLDLKSLKRDFELNAEFERSGAPPSQERRLSGANRQATRSRASASVRTSGLTQQIGLTSRARWLWLAAIVSIPFLFLGGWYWWRHREPDANRFAEFTVTQLVSRKNDLGESGANHARFSPDGKFVAYAAAKGGNSSIWLKQIGGGEPFTNQTEQGAVSSPIWSPDGLQIAFLSKRDAQNGIWTMPAFGGSPTQLKQLESYSRELVAWSREGKIYFVMQKNLYALDVASQQISQVTKFDQARDRSFSLSPDEERIAYNEIQDEQSDIWIIPKGGGPPQRATNDKAEDSNPVWTVDGQSIIYSSRRNGINQICLAHLDGRPPVQLTINDSNSEVMDVSSDGAKVLYATGRDESDLWSVKVDRPKELQLTSGTGIELWPDVAPDGKTITFQATRATTATTVFNCVLLAKSLSSDTPATQLAPDGLTARWSPDGKQIAFLHYANSLMNLWIVHAAGGDAKPLTTGGVTFGGYTFLPYNRLQTQDFQWSPDSNRLLYCANLSNLANVWQIGADGSGATQLSDNTDANFHFFNPAWSPDGGQVAWVAISTGKPGQTKAMWSIWSASQGKGRQIFESESVLGLVGWSLSGQELVVKSVPGKSGPPNAPADVSLFAIAVTGGPPRALAQLKTTYFANIQPAPAGNEIAFVTRQDGADSLQMIPSTGGAAKTIITSNDSRVYFSSLAWSPDGKTIYYGKQAHWSVLSMIDNFK